MAAKDADLTRDFSLDYVYINNTDVAQFEVSLLTTPQQSAGDRSEELFLTGDLGTVLEIELVSTPHGSGGSSAIYRMRGFDQNGAVNDFVSWNATSEDPTATQYAGSAGPVVNIRLIEIIG